MVWVILLRPRLFFCLPASVGSSALVLLLFASPGATAVSLLHPRQEAPFDAPSGPPLTSSQSCVTCLLKSLEKQGFLVEHFAFLKK